MIKLYKFQAVTDQFTTHSFVNPDSDVKATELCTIGDDTYISVPDGMAIPDQPECINLEEVTLTDKLKTAIKAASPHVQLINKRVVDKIREKYGINDEIKMARTRPSEEVLEYDGYVEDCVAWGQAEKAKLGL